MAVAAVALAVELRLATLRLPGRRVAHRELLPDGGKPLEVVALPGQPLRLSTWLRTERRVARYTVELAAAVVVAGETARLLLLVVRVVLPAAVVQVAAAVRTPRLAVPVGSVAWVPATS